MTTSAPVVMPVAQTIASGVGQSVGGSDNCSGLRSLDVDRDRPTKPIEKYSCLGLRDWVVALQCTGQELGHG